MHGRHNLLNALAAAAVATCFGDRAAKEIAEALATAAPSEMRGEVLRFAGGVQVVDDSYNSNPRSLLSMAEAVARGAARRSARRVVVAGEMLELGAEGAALHREAGRDIAGLGVDVLWGVRGSGARAGRRRARGGHEREATRFFETSEEAADALVSVRPGGRPCSG